MSYAVLTANEIKILSSLRSGACWAIYSAIKTFAFGTKTVAWPTKKTIQKTIGNEYSLSTIKHAIAQLVDAGLIERIYDEAKNLWSFFLKFKDSWFNSGEDNPQTPQDNPQTPIKEIEENKTHKSVFRKIKSKLKRVKIKSRRSAERRKPTKAQLKDRQRQNKEQHYNQDPPEQTPAAKWLQFGVSAALGIKTTVPNPAGYENEILAALNASMYDEWRDAIIAIIEKEAFDDSLSIQEAWDKTF